ARAGFYPSLSPLLSNDGMNVIPPASRSPELRQLTACQSAPFPDGTVHYHGYAFCARTGKPAAPVHTEQWITASALDQRRTITISNKCRHRHLPLYAVDGLRFSARTRRPGNRAPESFLRRWSATCCNRNRSAR